MRISDWSSDVCSSDLSGETDDFMAADHIVVSTKGMAHAHRAVERALLEKIHPDRIRTVASSFLVALAACFESDLILTAPARVIGRLAEVYGLRAVRPPILMEAFEIRQIGRESCRDRVGQQFRSVWGTYHN